MNRPPLIADVSYEHCDRYVYELSLGRFARVSEETREGACEGPGDRPSR
jgi:hypothetical protein